MSAIDYRSWADDEMRAAALFHGLAMESPSEERARRLREVALASARRAERWLLLAALEAGRTVEVSR